MKSERLTRGAHNEVEEAMGESLDFWKRNLLINVHLENLEGGGRITLRLI
jgi:hypothetical protein